MILHRDLDDSIIVIKLFPGINSEILEHILSKESLKGVIIETYGSGNATSRPWFVALLKKTIKRGVAIINVTQCSGGSVAMGQYETSVALKRIGVISGEDITTESAVAKLMFLLPKKLSQNVMKTIFETSLRGEIS